MSKPAVEDCVLGHGGQRASYLPPGRKFWWRFTVLGVGSVPECADVALQAKFRRSAGRVADDRLIAVHTFATAAQRRGWNQARAM